MSGFRTAFTIRRQTGGEYVEGRWEAGNEQTLTIQASVQPVRGKEIDALPEGRREMQHVKIYTQDTLQVQTNESTGDILQAFGRDFEVVDVEPWQSGVIPHYKALAELRT